MNQGSLDLRTWGGARRGAGRKPAGDRPRRPHARREPFRASQPVHVSLRVADHVWNLRSERAFAVIHRALVGLRPRPDFRVNHFAVLGNHLHLLAEASGPSGLSDGVRALSIRVARGLNRLMGRTGPVFEDRFHARALRTPAEVRNALRYVLANNRSHLLRIGQPAPPPGPDRFTSAAARGPRLGQLELLSGAVTREAASWLLRTAGKSEAGPRREQSDRAIGMTTSAESR